MSLRRLSRGRRWTFWSLAFFLWLLFAGLFQPPEVGRVLALGVPIGVALVHLWMASLRREPEPREPQPRRRPRPPDPRNGHRHEVGGNGHTNGSSHTSQHGPWEGLR